MLVMKGFEISKLSAGEFLVLEERRTAFGNP